MNNFEWDMICFRSNNPFSHLFLNDSLYNITIYQVPMVNQSLEEGYGVGTCSNRWYGIFCDSSRHTMRMKKQMKSLETDKTYLKLPLVLQETLYISLYKKNGGGGI